MDLPPIQISKAKFLSYKTRLVEVCEAMPGHWPCKNIRLFLASPELCQGICSFCQCPGSQQLLDAVGIDSLGQFCRLETSNDLACSATNCNPICSYHCDV